MIRFVVSSALIIFTIVSYTAWAEKDQPAETINNEDITVVSFEEMNYPPLARTARREGIVALRVQFDDKGKVVSAMALSGPKMLISDSISNVEKWIFRPNAGKAAVILYDFRLIDGRCNPGRNRLFVFREPNIAEISTCVDVWQPAK
jgi:hypothetical protein